MVSAPLVRPVTCRKPQAWTSCINPEKQNKQKTPLFKISEFRQLMSPNCKENLEVRGQPFWPLHSPLKHNGYGYQRASEGALS